MSCLDTETRQTSPDQGISLLVNSKFLSASSYRFDIHDGGTSSVDPRSRYCQIHSFCNICYRSVPNNRTLQDFAAGFGIQLIEICFLAPRYLAAIFKLAAEVVSIKV